MTLSDTLKWVRGSASKAKRVPTISRVVVLPHRARHESDMPFEIARRLAEVAAFSFSGRSDYPCILGPTSPCDHISGPHAQAEDEQSRAAYQQFRLRRGDLVVCPVPFLATLPVLDLAKRVGAQSVVLVDKSTCSFVDDMSRKGQRALDAIWSTRSAADRLIYALVHATQILAVDRESHDAVASSSIFSKRLCRHFETTTVEEFERYYDHHPLFFSRLRQEEEPQVLRCALLNGVKDDARHTVAATLQRTFLEQGYELPEPKFKNISISADVDSLDELDIVCTRRKWPSAAETLLATALITKLVARGTLVVGENSGTTPQWLPRGFGLPSFAEAIAGRRTHLFPEDILNPQRRAVYNCLQHSAPAQQ